MFESRPEVLPREKSLPSEEYAIQVMPPVLRTLDMTTIFIVIIFTLPIVMTAISAGAATFTYWIFTTLVFFLPCVIVTAQLGVMYPHEGSLYNWTHKAFGGYWSFFVAFCAWIPGVLVMVSGADIVVGYIQGLNPGWLQPAWQQGLAIIGVLVLSAILSVQPFRTVQHVVNIVVGLLAISVLINGVAGVTWLLSGHPSATNFANVSNWAIHLGDLNNPGNLAAYGAVVYAFLGMEVPLNMGAELAARNAERRKMRKVVLRHLFWGISLVTLGYLIETFSVLVVRGQHATNDVFAFVTTVDLALGKGFGNIVALAIIVYFIIEVTVYNYAYARLLFVAGIDERLPLSMAKLNKNRVPRNAIIVQTVLGSVFTAISFVVIPLFATNNSMDLANEIYNVSQAAATLLWVASTSVLFFNLAALYFRNKQAFHRQRIFPIAILYVCVVIGTIACVAGIIDTLFYSWIVQQISNQQWRNIVGSITVLCLVIVGIGSMYASSNVGWEMLEKQTEQESLQKSTEPLSPLTSPVKEGVKVN